MHILLENHLNSRSVGGSNPSRLVGIAEENDSYDG